MDASASPKVDVDFTEVCGFFVKIENTSFPTLLKQKKSIIKYTKLPDFDVDSEVQWPQKLPLQPRLRRIATFDDQRVETTRSLKSELGLPLSLSVSPLKIMTSSFTKRKIVTIAEDEEADIRPRLSRETRRSGTPNTSSRAVATDFKEKEPPQRTTSRLTPSKYSKKQENKSSAKINNNSSKDVSASKPTSKSKFSNISNISIIGSDNKSSRKSKEPTRNMKQENVSHKPYVSRNIVVPRERQAVLLTEGDKQLCSIKNKLTDNLNNLSQKKTNERGRLNRPLPQSKNKGIALNEITSKNKPVTLIHVPLDDKFRHRKIIEAGITNITIHPILDKFNKIDCSTEMDNTINVHDMNVGTDPQVEKVDKITEMERIEYDTNCQTDSDVHEDMFKKTFDSLDIPNFTLTKEKGDVPKEDIVNFCSQSLPNLQVPSLKITPNKNEKRKNNEKGLCNSGSYIIGRATLTYTTRQKINFHVVGNNNETAPNLPSSPLAYPMNVVSVFKKEVKNRELGDVTAANKTHKKKEKANAEYTNGLNEIKSLNCSYVFDSSKLVKPSDIISTIRVNNGLLQSDYISEQFQRELNFIDSFFESLQYLESCSLSDKCFADSNVENWVSNSGFDTKKPEYDSFFSKLENGAAIDDTETMASKSLCLLNLLIRDEQRRAKNLLFVLKMREDALKDFTKSQILWLENKKKQDNTDISTLKKKQRGALLKLQHECGEMQRMRKALLALSEKRKVALMKTKKNIELKLNNHVSVDQILSGKKKIKRNTAADRNTAPLKCFDLSSSGCDETTTSRPKSELALLTPELMEPIATIQSTEKSIQTGDSLLGAVLVDQSTDTAAENFVAVDGGYLNILFHNLSLPPIFSSGKQYEVNEEALRNIVSSSNKHHSDLSEGDIIEKFIDQIKHPELDSQSTPSTARSLVEELDQYYKGLAEEQKSPIASPEHCYKSIIINEISNDLGETKFEQSENHGHHSASTMTIDNSETAFSETNAEIVVDQSCTCESSVVSVGSQASKSREAVCIGRHAGPLPVPAGAAADADAPDVPAYLTTKSSTESNYSSSPESSASSQSLCPSVSSLSLLPTPAQCEAEELRRQQLAIEREIKALEQQQCQLLVVREIPDKPPPPYTPPTEARAPKLPRMFMVDETIEQKIHYNIVEPASAADTNDAFDLFIRDFCHEILDKHNSDSSDKPWDACNLLPQKAPIEADKLVKKTSVELKEVLTGVTPTVVSGVGARRSDHIDDILFTEWRRCEPEWAALHTDEAVVKNQIFESIFQKILSETVDEYKKTVLSVSKVTG